jgi:hypothetical protein
LNEKAALGGFCENGGESLKQPFRSILRAHDRCTSVVVR